MCVCRREGVREYRGRGIKREQKGEGRMGGGDGCFENIDI